MLKRLPAAIVALSFIVFLFAVVIGAANAGPSLDDQPRTTPAGHPNPIVNLTKGGDGFCTGFYVGLDRSGKYGVFITAGHCLADAESDWRFSTENDSGGSFSVKPDFAVVSSPFNKNQHDFSIVYVDKALVADYPPLTLGCDDAVVLGEAISAEGFPADLGRTAVKGYIASGATTIKASLWNRDTYKVELPVIGGNSGSPLFNEKYRVIGIVIGVYGQTSISLAQPIAPVCEVLGR